MIYQHESSLVFDEDGLPQGQAPIITTSVKRFLLFVELLMQSKLITGYSSMGVVTGLAGVGKSIAIQAFLNGQEARPHTGLPACIMIKVTPGSTPRALVEKLLISLGERPRGMNTNRYKIADEAAEAIVNNDLKVLFVDDGDQLNLDSFEFLRYIYGKTGCPIVVVGLRQIWRVINRYEKFASRVGLRLDFLPPEDEEVLQTILPQLIMPRWSFDPSSEDDYAMGKGLWEWVKPSFRNLRTVLQYASQLAELHWKDRITRDILKLSYQMSPIPKRREALAEADEMEEEPQTEYELESARRQEARSMKDQESI